VIIKIDAVEALAPVRDLRNAAVLTTTTTVLGILVAWLILLNPMGIRLKTTAIAAERIAQGHLDTFIGDRKRDEIGEVARTIDRLAKELKADKHQRTSVEAQLRHQATHDELTPPQHAGVAMSLLRFCPAPTAHPLRRPWSPFGPFLSGPSARRPGRY